ncbi:hypothetical protein LL06_00915 [Hoeflea sp. BAL378]|uniref:DUF2303 family protein n=1 Tax=Hoeflea sp. BAL378 TaxID=1547437 RepID=UPI0005137A30|nr:DUF2303 family protein [Hoeflea sp. BAL378]KGF71185.1 hypothetical protein LL06_00915 [Hoeflea sp. BAL378]
MAKTDIPMLEPVAIADSIEQIAKLAREAAGIDIVTLNLAVKGLPERVPIARLHGESPEFDSLKQLAEEWRLFPERKTGTAIVDTLTSFIDLTSRHATEDSVIFAGTDWKAPSLTAVIDYHCLNSGEGYAGNLGHRIHYPFPLSEQWKIWVGMNGKPMDQGDFAAFIEDNIADLSSPEALEVTDYEAKFATTIATPSALVTLSRGLAVHVSSKAKSAVTLQSGEGEIVWDEVHQGADGNRLKVPGLFMLQIPLFHMGETQRVPVRLRYRMRDGAVVWFYQIWRPDVAVTERVTEDFETAVEKTRLPGYIGKPEATR